MFYKLVVGNVRRNASDYAVYFVTVTLTAAMLFAFYSVTFSETVQAFSRGGEQVGVINLVSLAVVLACGWLIDYTTRVLLYKRAKELAVYYTLGLSRKRASLLFFAEHVIVGAVSLAVGILGGVLLFQVLSAILASAFQAAYQLRLSLNVPALLLTVLCYLCINLFVLLRSRRVLWRMRIPELLRLAPKSETGRHTNPHACLGVLTASMFLCAGCLIGVREGLLRMGTTNERGMWLWLIAGTLFGLVGVVGFYIGLVRLLPHLFSGGERWLFRGANLFLVRQLFSGKSGGGLLMGSVALLVTLGMTAFSSGVFLAAAMLKNAEILFPFDLMIALEAPDVDFTPQLELVEERLTVKDKLVYKIHTTKNEGVKELLGEFAVEKESFFQNGPQLISLGDYNGMLRQVGEPPLKLAEDEYAIGVNNRYQEEKLAKRLAARPELSLGGGLLRPGRVGNGGVLLGTQGPWRCLLILPDQVIQAAGPELTVLDCGLIVTTAEGVPAEMDALLSGNPVFQYTLDGVQSFASVESGDFVDEQGRMVVQTERGEIYMTYAGGGYQDSEGRQISSYPISLVREDRLAGERAIVLSLSFSLFYLGMVFSMIAATILSVEQLSDSAKFRERFTLLRRLGLSERRMNGLILRQLGFHFFLPLAVPLVLVTLLLAVFNLGFDRFLYSQALWRESLLATGGLFLSVYLCYFLVTCFHFQRNIFEN